MRSASLQHNITGLIKENANANGESLEMKNSKLDQCVLWNLFSSQQIAQKKRFILIAFTQKMTDTSAFIR
jgi:hypothetical protein